MIRKIFKSACFMIGMFCLFSCNGCTDTKDLMNDDIDLSGDWNFSPDPTADYRDIAIDQGSLKSDTSLDSEVKVNLTLAKTADVRMAKLMVLVRIGKDIKPIEEETHYCLRVSINGNKTHEVDLSPYRDGGDHWLDIPININHLKNGENTLSISSTIRNADDKDEQILLVALNGNEKSSVILRQYDISTAAWQPMAVPGVWEGNFDFNFSDNKGCQLFVSVNEEDWISQQLDYVRGQTTWIKVPVSIGNLKKDSNNITLDSSVLSLGNMTDDSLDLLHSGNQAKNKSFYSNDLKDWKPLDDRNLNIRIELKNKNTGEWESFGNDDGSHLHSCVIGLYKPNNMSYYQRALIELPDLNNYKEAQVLVNAHVGKNINTISGDSRDYDGVGWYERSVYLPKAARGQQWWLNFEAVDYKAEVFLNGHFIGSHEGGYTPFSLNLAETEAAQYGKDNIITVRVTDQTNHTGGGIEEPILIKETNAGFLQDTIGINYAGIWGKVSLVSRGDVSIDELFAIPDVQNNTAVASMYLTNHTNSQRTVDLSVAVTEKDGKEAGNSSRSFILMPGESKEVSLPVVINNIKLWSAESPNLYTMKTELSEKGKKLDSIKRDFGMRTISVKEDKLLLNDEPIFITGMLDWMMDYTTLSPTPSVETVEREILDLKTAGFNGVKFCLVVPPDYVLDVFDRMGMYAYIEYPIWMPVESDAFFVRSRTQMLDMVKKDRNHPSVIISDFNCEMATYSDKADELMRFLVTEAKKLAPNRLYLDNSSAAVQKYGDIWDTHPYYELNGFKQNVDMWVNMRNGAGDIRPVFFGEYADTDTIRDMSSIKKAFGGEPWWWSAFKVIDSEQRLRDQGFTSVKIERMKETSLLNAKEAKKYYIEESRKNSSIAGIYLTHIRDIAQTQPGFYDELGRLKYDVSYYKGGSQCSALLIETPSRNVQAGGEIVITPMLSHYSLVDINDGVLSWRIDKDGIEVSSGIAAKNLSFKHGDLYTLNPITVPCPDSDKAQHYTIFLTLTSKGYTTENSWDIWAYPIEQLKLTENDIRIYSENTHNVASSYGFADYDPAQTAPDLVITATITSEIEDYLRSGGKVIYLGSGSGPVPISKGVSFNSYAYTFYPDEGHPLSAALASDGYGCTQFLDVACNTSMDILSMGAGAKNIIGRMDLRGYGVSSYLGEYAVGNGILLQTTLSLNDEIVPGEKNILGQYLFNQMLMYMLEQ
ncbi:MAG: glycoside hydrolase family 2 protein [Eubacteriales bacterium]